MMRAKLDVDLAVVEASKKHRNRAKDCNGASEHASIATAEPILPD